MRFLRLQIGLLVVPADAGKSRVCSSNAGSGLEIVSPHTVSQSEADELRGFARALHTAVLDWLRQNHPSLLAAA